MSEWDQGDEFVTRGELAQAAAQQQIVKEFYDRNPDLADVPGLVNQVAYQRAMEFQQNPDRIPKDAEGRQKLGDEVAAEVRKLRGHSAQPPVAPDLESGAAWRNFGQPTDQDREEALNEEHERYLRVRQLR